MQDIFWGIVIIGIGIVTGGSVFFGDFTLFNMFFDGLGVFFIGKGAVGMMGQKDESIAEPSQPVGMQSVDGNKGTVESLE